MSQFFTSAILTATVASGIQLAAPFLLAALGETLGQRSGVINLGCDGIMLLGAFGAYYTALQTGSLLLRACSSAIGVGALLGLVTALISVTLKAEQGISGIGVYLFALGFSDLLFLKLVGTPLADQPASAAQDPAARPDPDASAACSSTTTCSSTSPSCSSRSSPSCSTARPSASRSRPVGENPAAADSVGVSVDPDPLLRP